MAQGFLSSVRDAGGTIGSIRLGGGDAVRGVYATHDIREGELLLSVPASLIFTAEGAASQLGATWRTLLNDGTLEGEDVLCVRLVQELQRAQDSRWTTWFSHLPAWYDTPLLWHDSWLCLLRCPILIARVRREREECSARLEWIERTADVHGLELPQLLSLDAFLWAFATIKTRGACETSGFRTYRATALQT